MARDIIWDTELVLPDTTIRFVSIVDILNFVVYYRLLVHWVWLKITHSHWKWHSLIVHSCGTCCWCFIQTVSVCCNVCWDVATYRWEITGTLLLLRMLLSVSSYFPQKICTHFTSLETSVIELKLLHSVQNGLSLWSITYFFGSLTYSAGGLYSSNISRNSEHLL